MSKTLLNEVNAIRTQMGLEEITEAYWSNPTFSMGGGDQTYSEPSGSTEPVGTDFKKAQMGSYTSPIKDPRKPLPAPPPKLDIKAPRKLTQRGDISGILQLMEDYEMAPLFENFRRNILDEAKVDLHDKLSTMIIFQVGNAINAINEAKKVTPPTPQSNAIANSSNNKLFKSLMTVLPTETIANQIKTEFNRQYGKNLNVIELQKFLKEILTGLSGLSNQQMIELIKRKGSTSKTYSKVINSLFNNETPTMPGEQPAAEPVTEPTAEPTGEPVAAGHPEPMSEPEPEPQVANPNGFDASNFMPDGVGNYDLRNVKPEARKAMVQKALEVLKRNSIEPTEKDVTEVMRQLIDDINNSGVKRVPMTSGMTMMK